MYIYVLLQEQAYSGVVLNIDHSWANHLKVSHCKGNFLLNALSGYFAEKFDRREMSMVAKTQESDVSVAAEPQQLSASYQQVKATFCFESPDFQIV